MEPAQDLTRLSATEARNQIAAGKLTATGLAEAYLRRIEERDGAIGAWTFLDPTLVMMQARARDAAPAKGLLHGVPIGIKDITDTEDMPTQYGSPIYRGHRPGRDAVCVKLMRVAGAVILGKTVTTEFATFSPGKTRHPHNRAHTPGGSSSGSAAGVADRHVPLATGTQTAGSIIRPAGFCGVIGYKPTFGRFNYDGIKVTAPSLDTLGFMANHFEDLHLLSGALLGLKEATKSEVAGKAPRIGFCRTPWWDRAEPEMRAAVEDAARKLADAGATVRDVELPHIYGDMIEAQDIIMSHEVSIYLRHEYENHRTQLTEHLQGIIGNGMRLPVSEIQNAKSLTRRCRAWLSEVFTDLDVIFTPSALGTAPAGIGATGDPIYERMWTATGFPCIGYRIGSGKNGLALGVQTVGPLGGDSDLIDFSSWMASHTRQPNP
ncbi:MAG: amidase [Candidatus Binataceae bacterium]